MEPSDQNVTISLPGMISLGAERLTVAKPVSDVRIILHAMGYNVSENTPMKEVLNMSLKLGIRVSILRHAVDAIYYDTYTGIAVQMGSENTLYPYVDDMLCKAFGIAGIAP